MIEWLAFPVAMAAFAALPKGKKNERKMIESIMKNVKYGLPDKEGKLQLPKYKKQTPIMDGETEIGITYHYSIPPGLPATELANEEKRYMYFTDSLMKPVEVEFKPMFKNAKVKTLQIHVYHEELPELFDYALLPARNDDWWMPLGKSLKGIVWQNFSHTPHFTIAGTTRFGKTVLLRAMMTYLIENHPDDCEFYIIDMKGRLEFNRYANLRQVKKVVGTVPEALALLTYLTNEDPEFPPGLMELQMDRYLRNGWSNTQDAGEKKRRFIIIDEGAQLAPQKWMDARMKTAMITCQDKLSRLCAVAGGIGFSVIFGTQYPTSDTLPRNIKMNSDAKISFRLPSGYASGVAIDDYGAEDLPSDFKGRALFKTHELRELQAPLLTHEKMWERLEKYQDPYILEGVPEHVVEYAEQTAAPGKNFVQFGDSKVRDKGAATTAP